MPIARYDGQIPVIVPRDHRTRRYSDSSSRRPISLDNGPNKPIEIKPLSINSTLTKPEKKSKFTVDSSELYVKREGKRHYPKDTVYSQEALLGFERPPTPAHIKNAVVEIKPRMEKAYKEHVRDHPSFRNRDSRPIYHGLSLGNQVALSMNTRPTKSSHNSPYMTEYMTITRPLASEVERYNSGRYEDIENGHKYALRCAEFGTVDLFLRQPQLGRRARSETNGRDSLLRNTFRSRGSTSVALNGRDNWVDACDPFDGDPSMKPVYSCTHVLDAYGIEDAVRTTRRREKRDPVLHGPSGSSTRRRLSSLDRGWY
ncbi:hypothetical protein MMC10_006961 [Thelotrema lepadinum]|nr:hypothetical protein [Thelotrema lepadinum]